MPVSALYATKTGVHYICPSKLYSLKINDVRRDIPKLLINKNHDRFLSFYPVNESYMTILSHAKPLKMCL